MKFRYSILSVWLLFLVLLFSNVRLGYAQHKVLSSLEDDITSLVESIKPSLVTIETESRIAQGEKRESLPSTFVGSGIIYTSDGYILTTASVVGGMESLKVTLPNQKSVKGKLIGTDEQLNLAVLKVDATGLIPAKLGDSDKVRVGSWLTVVGNSYGLPNAVALGLVNGVREDGFIQMSANVSPGNSGGPVLDTYGKVLGLVSAKLSEPSVISAFRIYEKAMDRAITIPSREIEIPSSGVSLALPVNRVKAIADQIIRYGSVKRGYLGIYPQDLNEKFPSEYKVREGALVSDVVEGSPAEKAGLLNGDVIIEFEGTEVKNSAHIRQLIENKSAGDKVELKILRSGVPKGLTAVLGEGKPAFGYFWRQDIEAPTLEAEYVNASQEVRNAQQMMEQGLNEKSLEQLKVRLNRLEQEMKRLNQEIERLKQEKSK
jgi:S1-C subfamily serine protease